MPHQPETNEPSDWHRFFAMEHNNKAWELAAKLQRSTTENEEMLDAAHAAAAHWKQVGTDLHIARAQTLLAAVHAVLGMGPTAWRLACRVEEFFRERECDDWERAYIKLISAHAAFADSRMEQYRSAYPLAREALESIKDPEDRKIVQASFDQVPVSA